MKNHILAQAELMGEYACWANSREYYVNNTISPNYAN